MAPGLNSLPNSSSANGDTPDSPTPASRSASISLQAAATMNAGLQHRRSSSSSMSGPRVSPNTGRRRSTVLMNLQHNDPSVPGPGEMVEAHGGQGATSPQPMMTSPMLTGGDPHHNRTPSLGELHQELEAEQEAQVNRLLQMIRQQQVQLQQLQAAQGHSQTSVAAEDGPPTSERSNSATNQTAAGLPAAPPPPPASASTPRSPALSISRTSFDRQSWTPSHGALSPRMRSTSISGESDHGALSGRDEGAFYQAETQSLVRENQMLRHRIRELERQVSDAQGGASVTREPATPSHLLHAESASEDKNDEQTARPDVSTE